MAKKKEPQPVTIRETLESDIKWELCTELDSAIRHLEQLREYYKDRFIKLEIDIHDYNSYGDTWPVVELIGIRYETELEKEKRLVAEENRKKKIEEAEREQLERLRKKYEGNKS
jgi:hypothetical protein